MSIFYRTNDVTRWGAGIGRALHDFELDQNFWGLDQRVTSLEAAGVGVGIVDVTVSSNIVTFHMSDHTEHSVVVPYPKWRFRGDFATVIEPSGADFTIMDVITDNGSTYMVIRDHHVDSGTVFDPGANAGIGLNYYGLMLSDPANMLPTGGEIGMVPKKASLIDYAVAWDFVAVSELSDVLLDSDIPDGDVLMRSGSNWVNGPIVMPAPGSGSLGGVELVNPELSKWIAYIDEAGSPVLVQPDFADLSGNPTEAQLDLVQTKAQDVSAVAGVLTIDRADGQIVRVNVTANITSIVINNWPPADTQGSVIFEWTQSGSFTVAYPSGVIWPDSTGAHVLSTGAGKRDRSMISSNDHGATRYGDTINQDYHA